MSAVTGTESTSTEEFQHALAAAASWLIDQQDSRGFWCSELEGDSILQSETILLLTWLGRERSELVERAARTLLAQQRPGGGWALFPGGEPDISGSVKAYFALKIAGHDCDSEPMRRARAAIQAAGGADRVNSFTRFYLALLGQIPYSCCPAVPPEMILLPTWAPLNIYRISAWSRTILVPLSVMWAFQPVRKLPAEWGIQELFSRPPEAWPPLECPQPNREKYGWSQRLRDRGWDRLFRGLDGLLKWIEARGWTPLRKRALRTSLEWIRTRSESSDGLGAIFPPIVWSVIAFRCTGSDLESPEVLECLRQLEQLRIDEGQQTRWQPCKSPVWDTALSLRAVAAARPDATGALERAYRWLASKEVKRRGDWAAYMEAPAAGWFFEFHNDFYPDTDDTAMVLIAAHEAGVLDGKGEAATELSANAGYGLGEACRRGVSWLLAMQNRDGGWGAFDRNNDKEFLCHVPFADHNAMIDPSTPDITARVLEAIAGYGHRRGSAAVDRAIDYLWRNQEQDGSWFGRWGVNHIYGTWQVLVGLRAAGIPADDAGIRRGAEWLRAHQQADGGWGETPESYADPSWRGRGSTTPSQTAWAMLGLLAAGDPEEGALERGASYLLRSRNEQGVWEEPEFTGTGFPLVFYLRYHMYPIYFPILALAQWQAARNR